MLKYRSPLVIASLLLMNLAACSEKDATSAAVPEVYVATVVQRDVPVHMEIVGQTLGSQDVDIRARVEGFLETVAFVEGSFVHKDDLLYQIDPKPLEAALAQAKANLATSQARLEQANITVKRMEPLAADQAVSLQELDNARATQNAMMAQVDAGRAAVDKAALDLGYARITAPIDGIVGITQVKAGNLVGAGESTLLTTLSQVDPIFFRGGISEADYLRMSRDKDRTVDQKAQESSLELLLADGSTYPYKGKFETIERAVDPTTGTLSVQVSFPNPERLLRPGQYGRVRFVAELRRGALLVLQRAVQEMQNQYSVAVVGPDNTVSVRNVKVGPRVGDLWVVEEGLQPNDRVVVEGLQRLKDGMTVAPLAVTDSDPDDPAATPAPAGKAG